MTRLKPLYRFRRSGIPVDDRSTEGRQENAQTAILREYLLYVIKGISMYAHRARQLSITDDQIDTFAAEALGAAVSDMEIDEAQLDEILSKATEIRARAKTLYEWACAPLSIKPEVLAGPAAMTLEASAQRILSRDASGLIKPPRRVRRNTDRYLEKLCAKGIERSAADAAKKKTRGQSEKQVYAFLHEVLNTLTQDLSTEELARLARRVEEEGCTGRNAQSH